MSTLVRPVSPTSQDWAKLVSESHQSSLFVLPSWLEAEADSGTKPLIIGAFAYGQLAAAVIAYEKEFGSVAPYQGLLLTAGATPRIVSALIDWLEGVGGSIAVWNAPSMLDVRPFQIRIQPWSTLIRYTHMLPQVGPAVPQAHLSETEHEMDVPEWYDFVPEIKTYTTDEGAVVWGKDLQERGYVLGFEGNFLPIVETLVQRVTSTDFCSTEGWTKRFHPKLRTVYGVIR